MPAAAGISAYRPAGPAWLERRTPTQAAPLCCAIAMASLAARDITKCPMPLSPSTSAVAGAVRDTVMFGRLLKPPALSRRTYCGRRKMPWPSAPVRSASLISSAQRAASGCGSPAAASASAISALVARAGMRATSLVSILFRRCRLALLFQNGRGVIAENRVAIGRRNAERAHLAHTFHRTHVVGIIAAEKHPRRADRGDQKFQRRFGMQYGVVEKAIEIFLRRLFQVHFRLGAHLPAVHPASALIGNKAAAMDHEKIELGIARQDAAEDQARGRDGGVERIADQVVEIISAQPVGAGDIAGMDQYQGVELGGRRPERFEPRVVEIAAADIGPDHRAVQAELGHGAA